MNIIERLQHHNLAALASAYQGLGVNYYIQLKDDKALEYCFLAIKTYEQIGRANETGGLLHNIAILHARKGNLKKAADFLQLAITINQQAQKYEWLVNNYNSLVGVHLHLHDYDQAIH